MSSHDPSSATEADVAGSYGVCDTVVRVCLAFASGLIVLTVAVCFWRVFAQGGRPAPLAGGGSSSSRRGLAPPALSAIPKFAYRRGAERRGDVADGAGGWAQCAICLGLVREGELVRRLPACRHLFHAECIDMWLYSHATCPLCRCDVGEAAAAAGEKV